MKIIPNGNRILIERRDVPPGVGIVLPQGVAGASTFHVVDVGQGYRLDNGTLVPIPFKAGDEIVMSPAALMQLNGQLYGGKDYFIVDAGAIAAKIERTTPTEGMGYGAPKIVMARQKNQLVDA